MAQLILRADLSAALLRMSEGKRANSLRGVVSIVIVNSALASIVKRRSGNMNRSSQSLFESATGSAH
jgi:hypothetical protein